MAFIGNTPTTQAFTPAVDYFSGNASTTAFTLSRPVASVAQVQVVVNNVAQNPSSAYTISSNTITFTSAPSSGTNNIYVYYTSPITQVIAPSQGSVNTTSLAGGTITTTADATLNGLTVGKGGGAVTANTALGSSALSVNTTGDENVAVGYNALSSNITGSSNVAVGRNALALATTDNNVAVGRYTLAATTTGTTNASVGTLSLRNNTTGSSNSALGYQALNQNTTASNNTAVGYQAGYSSTTGDQNVYLGVQAGYTGTTGTHNLMVGFQAGYSSTGSYNTFVGCRNASDSACGQAMTTGTRNTILGGYSGNQGGLDIRTGSNYIVLSDGDGNPRLWGDSGGSWMVGASRSFARALVDIPTSGGNAGAPLAISRGGDGGSMVIFYSTSSTTTVIGSIGNSSNTNTTYNTSSDYRLKENIAPMTGALNAISALKPVTWKWKSTGEDGQGFIAHELAEVVPDCVTGEKDAVDADGNPVYQGVDTSYLVATLTKAIQELSAKNDALTARIEALENK